MIWARQVPWQYFDLFLHFSGVNDPQIKSDMFSILMCLVFDFADDEFVQQASEWILSNILSPLKRDQNRDISVRYYSIAIVEKAKMMGLYSDEDVNNFLPPYCEKDDNILLNKAALSGTRMSGYSAIRYDLARYVLIDHFTYSFNVWDSRQLDQFVEIFSNDHPEYEGVSSDQFILSAAYAFVLEMGWNEKEFYNYKKDDSGNIIGGADCSILSTYPGADHGAQSSVMTICEKYVWAARNYISGFLCDRLLFGNAQIQITDYNQLDDFIIPIQEIKQIDPDNIPIDRPWYIPEKTSVIFENKIFDSKKSISDYIKTLPDIDWKKWIFIDNSNNSYAILNSKLLALKLFSCFYGLSGVETCLFINSIVVPESEVLKFVEQSRDNDLFQRICDPTDWDGGIDVSCYITPKEICWFPWKKHFDSSLAEEFPNLKIHSAVDQCCYNFPEYSDVYYYMPSALLRRLLGIVDTDGYLYYDQEKNIVSEFSIAGDKWRTTQEYVLVDENSTLQKLHENGMSLQRTLFRESLSQCHISFNLETRKEDMTLCLQKTLCRSLILNIITKILFKPAAIMR